MRLNMGIIDRVIRISIAVVFVVLFLIHQINGTIAVVLLGLGVMFSFTGIVGICPLYIPIKLNTNKK